MPRNATLDYARLLAAFGIVLFHTGGPGAAVGYAALPFFLMLMIVLTGPAARRQGFAAFADDRALRLLRPWLIWSLVYGALKLAEVLLTDAALRDEFLPWMLLTGPALHLWFLPFAWVASLAAWPVLASRRTRSARLMPALLAALGVALLGAEFALGQSQHWPQPVGQWLHVLPSFCLGLALALALQGAGAGASRAALLARTLPLVAGFAATAALAGWAGGGWTGSLGQIVLAALAVIGCLMVPLPASRAAQLAAATALGVYLCHPLVLSVLDRTLALDRASLPMALLGCAGAFGLALLLHLGAGLPRRALARLMPVARAQIAIPLVSQPLSGSDTNS